MCDGSCIHLPVKSMAQPSMCPLTRFTLCRANRPIQPARSVQTKSLKTSIALLTCRWSRCAPSTRMAHAGVMFRRTLIEQVGPYDETVRYAQDYELWRRMVEVSQVANLPDRLLIHRVGNSDFARITMKHSQAQHDSAERTSLENIRRLLGEQEFDIERMCNVRVLVLQDGSLSSQVSQQAIADLGFILECFLTRYCSSGSQQSSGQPHSMDEIESHIARLAWDYAMPERPPGSWAISRQLLTMLLAIRLSILRRARWWCLLMAHILGPQITHRLLSWLNRHRNNKLIGTLKRRILYGAYQGFARCR